MSSNSNVNVLVVDDNKANTVVLSTMLEHFGMRVEIAESGMEAIEKVCGKGYQLILMDYLMPDMDGVETTRQIDFVSDAESKPVIYGVSATVDDEVVDLFKKAGATGVMGKPVKLHDVEELLDRHNFLSAVCVEEPEPEAEDDVSFLDGIEGLNYEEGISLMAGSVENYMKVLSVSVRNIMENYGVIDAIKDTEQMETLVLHFHSLKGIFLNIGADDLAEQSKMFEFAARELENMYVHENVDEYLLKVKKFHDQLDNARNAYRECTKAAENQEEISDSEFADLINELKAAIEDFDYLEITSLIEKLQSQCTGQNKEYIDQISAFIDDFQYDEAQEIIEKNF